ncbi:MAG: hypothetical protein KF701_09785 [Anaerolineales bacterium]|nr:MAG: hypothetical protein KF701_09785 [Anaerolineales bacterium]
MIVELRDEAGRILARQIHAIETTDLNIELAFEVSRPPLPAQLSVRTLDAYGRTQALNSVELTLLSEGPATIVPGSEQAHITLNQPADGQSVPANLIAVSGTTYVADTRPLSIQLITREGRVLAAREVYPQGELSRPAIFETVLAVSISEPTWVQIAVSAPGRNNAGPAHFIAVEVLLEP